MVPLLIDTADGQFSGVRYLTPSWGRHGL